MATVTITQLPNSNALTGSEVLPIVQGDVTVQTTVQSIANLAGLSGTNFIYVAADGTDTENATELSTAYTTAKTMSPSATNRITIIASPGNYNFGSTIFELDTAYIDLVSLDGNRSVIFNAPLVGPTYPNYWLGSIAISANNVYLKGVDVLTKGLIFSPNLTSVVIENSKGGSNFISYDPDNFASNQSLSGTFIDCECTGIEGFYSFGILSGTFINCKGGNNSFSGYYTIDNAVFENCEGGDYCFQSNKNYNSAVYTNCVSGQGSFQGNGGEIASVCTNCTGDLLSFSNAFKLYYCRLTSGTFGSIFGDGVTVLCIDGNNTINTQNT